MARNAYLRRGAFVGVAAGRAGALVAAGAAAAGAMAVHAYPRISQEPLGSPTAPAYENSISAPRSHLPVAPAGGHGVLPAANVPSSDLHLSAAVAGSELP